MPAQSLEQSELLLSFMTHHTVLVRTGLFIAAALRLLPVHCVVYIMLNVAKKTTWHGSAQ